MSETSERFRKRAKDCRNLAPQARLPMIREELLRLAEELDEEADLIEAEEEAAARFGSERLS